MSKTVTTILLVCAALFSFMFPAWAQSCPPTPEARALERQRDPFGTYCMRVGQAEFARQKCSRARSAIDLDECQYLSASLVRTLRDCAALGGPYGAKCAAMMGQGSRMLGTVARNPVLQQHRAEQRDSEVSGNRCRGDIGAQCMGRCGNDTTCLASCNSGNSWRCNR
jgi:hypothetical protein